METPEHAVKDAVTISTPDSSSPTVIADAVQEALKIAIVGQKGGVGKSTLSRTLAVEAVLNGFNTKIADLDHLQGTSIHWRERREDSKIAPDIPVGVFSELEDALSLAKDLDLLILDTPGGEEKWRRKHHPILAKTADLIVIPSKSSLDDLYASIQMVFDFEKAGMPKHKIVIALSRMSTKTAEKEAREYCAENDVNVLPGCLYEQRAYEKALDRGNGLTEINIATLKESADKLIQALVDKVSE